MKELMKQQQSTGDLIYKFVVNTNKTGKKDQTKGFLSSRRILLEKYWATFEENHIELLANSDAKEVEKYFAEDFYTVIECEFAKARGFLIDSLEAFNDQPTNNPEQQFIRNEAPRQESSNIWLPAISIPQFEGDFNKWTSFHDLFETLVVKNSNLSKVNKLHHLKASLVGEAELVLRQFTIEENNFDPAWALLNRRYSNKRMLVNSQISKLISQSKINSSSADAVRRILDVSTESVTSLKSLLDKDHQFETLAIYILTQKLDSKIIESWEQSIKSENEFPNFEEFCLFLENYCRTQDLVNSAVKTSAAKNFHPSEKMKADTSHHVRAFNAVQSKRQCTLCGKASHFIYKCFQFKAMSAGERLSLVQSKGWCVRCLSSQHKSSECPQKWDCIHCKGPHNNMLHQSAVRTGNSQERSEPPTTLRKAQANMTNSIIHQADVHANHVLNFYNTQTLLGTAQVLIKSSFGQSFSFRALVDPGSDHCIMSRTAAEILQLPRRKCNSFIKSVGETTVGKSTENMSCLVESMHDRNSTLAIDAVLMGNQHLTSSHPPSILQSKSWPHLQNLQLADPRYAEKGKIDIILGADTYTELFLPEIRKGPQGSPSAQKTIFGYVLIGKLLNEPSSISMASREIQTNFTELSVCEQLRKFWELEEVSDTKRLNKDETYCEAHYQSTHTRKPDGRYIIEIPFKTEADNLPKFQNTRNQAYIRLCQVEKRLHSNPSLMLQYNEFMDDYIKLGHMHPIANANETSAFYLPHHAIIRPSSLSTKLRVVFDASAKDRNGISLNSTMHVGPTIQQDLISILLRWRKHKVALTADVEKMYRQIEVSPKHQPFQRILWRNENNNIIDYQLSTVTYGTACAPFVAIRTMQQLAIDEQHNYPHASDRTLKDMYVDDFISGCDSVDEAKHLQKEMVHLFKSGGLNLRKWTSNLTNVLTTIPTNNREDHTTLNICRDDILKTLGLYWHTMEDEFQFQVKLAEKPSKLSMRSLLSDVSKLFDPLGFLAPVIISAKILYQSLWRKGLEWDDDLPEDVSSEWTAIRTNLFNLETIKIPRWIGISTSITNIQYHGFCDASVKAYAAVIYCRTEHNNNINVHLITSKTRVAPIKTVSLPNLELCGATLLSKLIKKVQISIEVDAQIFAWTDSTIVLDWLRSNDHKQTFVANRIGTILDNLEPFNWRHVRSKDNPADVASRGICPSLLSQHSLWWHGPEWLHHSTDEWPKQIKDNESEERTVDVIVAATSIQNEMDDLTEIMERFSCMDKLVQVLSRCIQIANIWKKKSSRMEKVAEYNNRLTTADYRATLNIIIKHVQGKEYSKEIHLINKNINIGNSKISSLCPFIDSEGFLRVGGRLRNADMNFDSKHPLLIPSNQHLTKLVIRKTHLNTLHGGLKLTSATIRQKYWIPNSRRTIRNIIYQCVTCYRHSVNCKQQIMGALPAVRVNQSKVFSHTGVDYAGPFDLRLSRHRGKGTYKGFVAVFVCMATKAIHLELASDLSSKTFISAFKRFVSRRGPCSDLYSDNGTNFVGANRELLNKFQKTMAEISSMAAESLSIQGTQWHFIPANSPNFGGLWEAAVKSFKYHLKRIIDQSILTYEEFYTLLAQIEATLNSRPLCSLSSDPNDLNALTPGHFLTGGPINSVPEPSLLEVKENRLDRWQLIVKMHQDFWNIWSKEYLNELQQRPKQWIKHRDNMQAGDIVIIKDDRLPPSSWILARVTKLHPGDDGIVRVVSVKHKNGETKRAVNRLCRLPIDHSN